MNVSDADSCAGFAGFLPVAASFFSLLIGIEGGDMENEASESVWSLLLLGIDAKSSGAERLLLRVETISINGRVPITIELFAKGLMSRI